MATKAKAKGPNDAQIRELLGTDHDEDARAALLDPKQHGSLGRRVRKEARARIAKVIAAERIRTPIEAVFERPIILHVCRDGTVSYRDKRKNEPVFNGVALPVFSVDTVDEARRIQIRFCHLQYSAHPHRKGPKKGEWYVLNWFAGEIEDLDRVMLEFATFWAEHIRRTPEAKAWAKRLGEQLAKRSRQS